MKTTNKNIRKSAYTRQLVAAVGVVTLFGVGAWFFAGRGDSNGEGFNLAALWRSVTGQDDNHSSFGGSESVADGTLDMGYENVAYGFRFHYPSWMELGEMDEDEGYVVLAEGNGTSIQIFILPWDEGTGVLTPARIRQDLPNIVIENPQVVNLQHGVQALIFESGEDGFKTREVWITSDRYLYQVTAGLENYALLSGMMATWEILE